MFKNENKASQMSAVAQKNDYYRNCNIPNLINKWKKKNPWLFLKDGKLFCKACIDYTAINKAFSDQRNKFSNEGITNIRSSSIIQHGRTHTHLAAVQAATQQLSPNSIGNLIVVTEAAGLIRTADKVDLRGDHANLQKATLNLSDDLSARITPPPKEEASKNISDSTTQMSAAAQQNDYYRNCNVPFLVNKWRKRHPWLFLKDGKLFCQICIDYKEMSAITCCPAKNTFCHEGSTNFRASPIEDHARSLTHLLAVRATTQQSSEKEIDAADDEISLKEENEGEEILVKEEVVENEEICIKQEVVEEEQAIAPPFSCELLPESIKEEIAEEITIKEEPKDEETPSTAPSPLPQKPLPTLAISPLPSLFNGPLASKFSLKINYNSLKFKLPKKRRFQECAYSVATKDDHLQEKTFKEEIKEEYRIEDEI